MAAASLCVSQLRHRHPGRSEDTPQELSLTLEPRARVLLTGRNGSGKTTLLHRIVGLLDGPGSILVDGMLVEPRKLRRIRQRVGFLWQNPEDALLLPTVLDDVAFGPLNDGASQPEAEKIARDWLDRLGMGRFAAAAIGNLSMGEKQLVSLAGVLARDPGLLLLDEPTASLDTVARRTLLDALRLVDATMLVVTHDPAQFEPIGPWQQIDLKSSESMNSAELNLQALP